MITIRKESLDFVTHNLYTKLRK